MPARVQTLLLAAALFLLNAYLCRGLFSIEFLRHMGSIEGAYIGISRYAIAHWRDLTWFPLWYNGVPYQNTYPPLLHWGVALIAWLRGVSTAHAYHFVTAIAYCLGPITVFALALRLSGSRWAAFAAGWIYSVTSMSAWLVPAIANDLGSILSPRRLQALVYYGEGPHVSALTLLPLGLLFLDLAMTRRCAPYVLLAALSLGAIVLTNWLAAFALALLVVSYAIARIGPKGWDLRELAWMSLIGAAAYCIVLPWAPPSTIAVTQLNARTIGGDYSLVYQALPRWGAVILLAAVWIKVLARRLSPHLQCAILFTFFTALLTLMAGWFDISILPQPIRYHLEMEMALALLLAFAGHAILKDRPRWMGAAALGLLFIALFPCTRNCRRYARDFLISKIDITATTEWKTAQWLNQHWTGERVLMPGSTSFWLTAFSDTPEIAGGFEQGATNYMIRVALYGIYTGATAGPRDAEYSILWMKALGVQAVGVSGPASGEFYKPFHDPKKFEGVLEPLWRDGDDVIYRVGAPRASLARVIRRDDQVTREPVNGVDVDPLRPYVAALDNPAMPRADFKWTSQHSATIATTLDPGQIVSIQISWHPGWRAIVNGRRVPVTRDLIGLTTIDPAVAGPCVIDFIYDGGTEMRVAHWLCALTVLLLVAASARVILKKPW